MTTAIRVLTVCTFNQTRSVALASFLSAHFNRVGVAHEISSAGFRPGGHPATQSTVEALARMGHDVRHHRSSPIDTDAVDQADLILCAEQLHVIETIGRWPAAWNRTFTAPEFVLRAGGMSPGREGHTGPADADTSAEAPRGHWLGELGSGRSRTAYRNDGVPEIIDPTGRPTREFAAAMAKLDALAAEIVELVARRWDHR